MKWKPPHPAYERLLSALVSEPGRVYVVGGAVRDFLLGEGHPNLDLDVVLDVPAIPIARRVADNLGWAFYTMDSVRDIARLVFTADQGGTLKCDVAGMRGATIQQDLAARDFTVNAMALAVGPGNNVELLDFHGGREDLDARVLRRVSPLSLSDDSIRLLRAVRLIAQLGLSIEPATRSQLERLADTVRLSTPERERDELWRMLASPHPRQALEMLDLYGLLHHVFPELASTQGVEQTAPHFQDVYSHTLATIEIAGYLRNWLIGEPAPPSEYLGSELVGALDRHKYALRRHFGQSVADERNRAQWLVWHALFHDMGKPETAVVEQGQDEVSDQQRRIRFFDHETLGAQMASERLEHLRFSRHEISLCSAVVENHMRLHHLHSSFPAGDISRRAVYRFLRDTGGWQSGRSFGVDTIMLSIADFLATYREPPPDWPVYLAHAAQLLDAFFASGEGAMMEAPPLVDGNQLMQALGIKPGPHVGRILEQIREAQAVGEVTTEDEAMNLAQRLNQA